MVFKKTYMLDQWYKIKDPDMSTCNYRHLISNKNAKNIHFLKKTAFLTNDVAITGYPHVEE